MYHWNLRLYKLHLLPALDNHFTILACNGFLHLILGEQQRCHVIDGERVFCYNVLPKIGCSLAEYEVEENVAREDCEMIVECWKEMELVEV